MVCFDLFGLRLALDFTAPALLCYADMSHLYAHGPDMRCNNQEPI